MADKRANANLMVSIATSNTRMRARNPAASDIRKINIYVTAFAYTPAANKKQGYQDQKTKQCSAN